MTVQSSAPSNIALIKYMGKIEGQGNQPTNSSLSWTLENLRSFVRISSASDLDSDQWSPLQGPGLLSLQLSEKSVQRFLEHFQNLKKEFEIEGAFLLQSANNFPSDCGLASSASSFAALTRAALDLFSQLGSKRAQDVDALAAADLSRRASGSSCRSFFGPWALWFRDGVRPIEFPMSSLLHQVIVVESGVKAVSSSEAHRRVVTSPHFSGRPERAEARLAQLIEVFRSEPEKQENWTQAYRIVWDEFQDMHQLFETSSPAFSYMQKGTHEVLQYLENLWSSLGDGPLVTMDAGANVHLLFRQDQRMLAEKIDQDFSKRMKVVSSFSKVQL